MANLYKVDRHVLGHLNSMVWYSYTTNIKTKLFYVTDKNKEFKLIVFNEIRRKGITKGLQNERRRQTIT